jgi:uncharacterized membrane protein
MSRKTFKLILMIAGFGILMIVLTPRILEYITQPDIEATIVGYSSDTEIAVVENIIEEGEVVLGEVIQPYQILSVAVEQGDLAGNIFEIEYGTRQIRNDMIMIEKGDRILINVSSAPDGRQSAHFLDYYRRDNLLFLLIIFSVFSVLISGWKGVRSLVGILLSLAIIILIILPGIQEGRDPLAVSIFGAFFFVAFSLYIVYGWNVKTHTAVLGSFLSLTITGILAFIFVNNAKLTGYGDENMFFISQLTQNTLDVRSLLLAGILIGTLGVLDDLVISQSSAVFELYKNNPNQKFLKLFKSAMNIGQDHIAATVNTLVLAYAGASLPMLLLFSFRNVDYGLAVNLEYIAEEIVRTMVGSLGLFAAVPITTALASLIAVKYRDLGKIRIYLGPLNE